MDGPSNKLLDQSCLLFTLKFFNWFSDEDNYHEIQSVGESPAAFFDILAPPYHTNEFDEEDDGHEPRDCHFFTEHKDISTGGNNTNNNIHSGKQPNILWLRRIPCPNDYTCSEEPYCGPRLKWFCRIKTRKLAVLDEVPTFSYHTATDVKMCFIFLIVILISKRKILWCFL